MNLEGITIGYFIIFLLTIFWLSPPIKEYFYISELRWLYLFPLSFLVAYIVTPPISAIARWLKILDMPDQERKIHSLPTPLLGGIAIYFAFTLALLYNYDFSDPLKGVVIGGTVILAMGAIDDIRPMPARLKLFGQIIAVLIMIRYGVILSFIPHYVWGSKILEALITIVFVMGIANALNFLDGLNGLAAGLGGLSLICFAIIAWQTGQWWLGYIAICLGGACIGFLPHNFKERASIFLGDSGSTFIGFTVAGLAVMGGWATKNPMVALSVPILVLGVLIFDMTYITLSRIMKGQVRNFREWVEYVGKDHFHHRLMALGLSRKQTVLFIYTISLCLGISAIVLRYVGVEHANICSFLLLIQGAVIFLILAIIMSAGRRHLNNR